MAFHPGQNRAWKSTSRFLAILAGTRGGKTSFSPLWLHREIKRMGCGDYLLCAPSYKLLDVAAVPALQDLFQHKLGIGTVKGGAQGRLELNEYGEKKLWGAKQDKPTRIIFGHADQPESLEAAQYKAAVCDEAGQKRFKPESWEAIQRRLSIDKGRCLFPTTPYAAYGWLKEEVCDRAVRRHKAERMGLPVDIADADYDVVSFESIENPAFPLEEWDRAEATLPAWKFDLFYRGRFTKPAGAIYDCFQPEYHIIDPAAMNAWSHGQPPTHWPRLCMMDFGSPNFCGLWAAQEMDHIGLNPATGKEQYNPTGRWVAYREYWPDQGKTAAEHVGALMAGELRRPDDCVGGSHSESQWRNEFAAAGLNVGEPDQPDVEVGIQRVYAAFKTGHLFISKECPKLIRNVQAYSRELDDMGEPTNDIEDKETFHGCDALRYGISWVTRPGSGIDLYD